MRGEGRNNENIYQGQSSLPTPERRPRECRPPPRSPEEGGAPGGAGVRALVISGPAFSLSQLCSAQHRLTHCPPVFWPPGRNRTPNKVSRNRNWLSPLHHIGPAGRITSCDNTSCVSVTTTQLDINSSLVSGRGRGGEGELDPLIMKSCDSHTYPNRSVYSLYPTLLNYLAEQL